MCWVFGLVFLLVLREFKLYNAEMLMSKSDLAEMKDDFSALENLYQAQSQVNLRIMNVIKDSEQRRLQRDSVYLVLIDKIN